MTDAFGYWLAGFIDGEGTLVLSANKRPQGKIYRPQLRIALRYDDREILEECARQTGLGKVYQYERPPTSSSAAYAVWSVSNKKCLSGAVELLTKYPLRSKKSNEFPIWKRAVALYGTHLLGGGTRIWEHNRAIQIKLGKLQNELVAIRRAGLS